MRRKKLTALFISLSLILSGNGACYGAEYLNTMGADEVRIADKDPDNSTVRFDNGVLIIEGSGSSTKSKIREWLEKTGEEKANEVTKISYGPGITRAAGTTFDQDTNGICFPNLKEIEFQSGHALDEIGQCSFRLNKGLSKINVMPGKKAPTDQGFEISHMAFYGCSALNDVTLNNVWHLGKRSFYGCDKITSIDLGYLHNMRGDALEGCTGLSEIKIDNNDRFLEIGEDGFVYKKYCNYYNKDGQYNLEVPALITAPYKKVNEMVIPRKGTKTIGYGAFAGNKNVKGFKAVAGVKQIQARAFYNCTSLEDIYISKSVKHMGNEAFCRLTTNTQILEGDETPDFYDDHPYAGDDERIVNGTVKNIYYGGSEEDWKAIVYDKYDKKMQFVSDGGYVADNMAEVGLSENVIIHYNYFDEDTAVPVTVKKGGMISASCCAILGGSGKIGFDTGFLKFTPTSYTITPLDGSSAKGLKINKKMLLKAKNVPGSYDVTLTDGNASMVIRIYVEKPVMKKYTADNLTDEDIKAGQLYDISKMLSGVAYLEPEKYESKKPAVAEISETGTIKINGKGSTKITVTICDKKFKAAFKVKMKKPETSGKEE